MTKIKLCGLSRPGDIEIINELKPEYIGFVFALKSKRYIIPEKAADLKRLLNPGIKKVSVFVDETSENVACLLNSGIIDISQLHGREDERYIHHLRQLTSKPVIKAFRIESAINMEAANRCTADYVLLDSGAGAGTAFDWKLIQGIERPYFLAGGLGVDDVKIPIVFMTYANVVFSYGSERFISRCKEIEIDGLILPDLPFEEKEEFLPFCHYQAA